MKKQQGITLIALVITIIVLLILAGVSISMVIGNNGILNQASIAGVETKKASEQEQIELAYLAAKTNKMANHDFTAVTKTELETALRQNEVTGVEVSEDGDKIVVDYGNGKTYTVENEIVTPNYTTDSGNTGTTGEYGEFTAVITDLKANPSTYLAQAQALGQDTSISDIAIGTDGEVANLSYWDYYITDDGQGMSLGDGDGCTRYGGYKGTIDNTGSIVGKMPQYIYKANNQTVYPVTRLDYTFNAMCVYDMSNLTIVPEIPTTVKAMKATFQGTNIKSITIPDGVQFLESSEGYFVGAFANCKDLESVDLPDNLISIDGNTFYGCENLITITIPKNVTSIGSTAFAWCDNLKEVRFEMTTVPAFGDGCFYKSSGEKTTFYFKNSTVAAALKSNTDVSSGYHYNSTYGTKSTNYSW